MESRWGCHGGAHIEVCTRNPCRATDRDYKAHPSGPWGRGFEGPRAPAGTEGVAQLAPVDERVLARPAVIMITIQNIGIEYQLLSIN